MKKRVLAVFLTVMMILSLTACGGNSGSQSGNDKPDGSQSQPQQSESPKEGETPKESEPAKEEASYEITYQKARTYTNSIGTTWVQVIVEITNTGSKNLYLSSGSCDLEDANGALVKSMTMVSTYPSVLAPGEKGYMYEETTLDDYSEEGELVVLPREDVKEAKVDLVRFNISDVKVSDSQYGQIKVMGRVENQTDEAVEDMIYIVAFFYDADGTMIGSAFTILTDDLDAGAKIGFEMTEFSMPNDIMADSIAETTVYAYPLQYQFF